MSKAKYLNDLYDDKDTTLIKRLLQYILPLEDREYVTDELFKKISNIKFAINCEYATKNDYVTNNEELAIFPPVTGS